MFNRIRKVKTGADVVATFAVSLNVTAALGNVTAAVVQAIEGARFLAGLSLVAAGVSAGLAMLTVHRAAAHDLALRRMASDNEASEAARDLIVGQRDGMLSHMSATAAARPGPRH